MKRRDLDLVGKDGDFTPEDFHAADAEHLRGEAEQRAAAALDLTTDPAMRRALLRDPAMLGRLERILSGSAFFPNPEIARNYANAVAQATLQAVGAVLPAVRSAAAGRASGNARRAETAERDGIVQTLWADTDPGMSDSARILAVQKKLRKKPHDLTLPTWAIRRIVKKKV